MCQLGINTRRVSRGAQVVITHHEVMSLLDILTDSDDSGDVFVSDSQSWSDSEILNCQAREDSKGGKAHTECFRLDLTVTG